MPYSKKILLFSILFTIGILSLDIVAQSANSKDWKTKAKTIIGEPESVTIVTDEGTYIFDKEEAKDLVKHLKSDKHQFKYVTKHGDKDHNVMIFGDSDKIKKHHLIEIEEIDGSGEASVFIIKKNIDDYDLECLVEDIDIDKKIEVKIDDGVKTVEIITEKNGEKTVEVYTGEEADEYLMKHMKKGKHKSKHRKIIKMRIDSTITDNHMIWVTDDIDEDGVTEKEIKIKIEDGKKKVTITKTKDGEKIAVLKLNIFLQ